MKEKKIYVYRDGSVRVLKPGVNLEEYLAKRPHALKCNKPPTLATLNRWVGDGVAKAIDGCRVEPDGTCEHGCPSWLLALGYI